MIKQTLTGLLLGRHRTWGVITVTFAIGLALILPAADEYSASRDRHARLTSTLNNTRSIVARLDEYEGQVAERVRKLENLETRTTGEKQAQAFRERIVVMVRESGCQMRRIRLGQPTARRWHENDKALDQMASTTKGPETPLMLNVQPVSLSVTGTTASVKGLLEQLHRSGKMMHTKSFALRPAGLENPKEVLLDVEFLLFNLTEVQPATTT